MHTVELTIVARIPESALAVALRQAGLVVNENNTVPDVSLLARQPPEILLVEDALLSIEGLKILRDQLPSTLIILLTPIEDLEARIDYLEAGADTVFDELVRPQMLIAHLRALMRRHNLPPLAKDNSLQADVTPAECAASRPLLKRIRNCFHLS